MTRVAINGFGRIGRTFMRVWLSRPDLRDQVEIVAINTSGSMNLGDWVHLLRYDTSYGKLTNSISFEEHQAAKETSDEDPVIGQLMVDGRSVTVLAQRDPEKLPWKENGVDLVVESTGVFRDEKGAGKHITAGAKRVLISAPSKGGQIGTHVLGVNAYDGEYPVADNASCTTNCVAPVTAVLHSAFGIKKAALTTVHAYTDDQNLQDGSHDDLRRARAAAQNIVPTSTGAAVAVTQTIPELQGMFDGVAIRVPVVTGSISDITCVMAKNVTVEEINSEIKKAADSDRWRGLLGWTEEPLVSSDIVGRSESSIVDLSFTQVIDGDLVKVLAWYDNEWGYCNRLLEQAAFVGRA